MLPGCHAVNNVWYLSKAPYLPFLSTFEEDNMEKHLKGKQAQVI